LEISLDLLADLEGIGSRRPLRSTVTLKAWRPWVAHRTSLSRRAALARSSWMAVRASHARRSWEAHRAHIALLTFKSLLLSIRSRVTLFPLFALFPVIAG